MPRRAPPPIAVAPVNTLLPPPPPSPLVQKLRQDYRWASISQFCWTFSDAFGLVDWDIDRLEADFDGDETQVIPDLLVKLLFALTYNRQIKRDNVMEHIRKQYEKRARTCVLGTIEEPVEWATLGLGLKVQMLYELCEIQMEDAARFRGLLKSEEDAVSWRIDPVGWDKDGNTYYLFDDNRLWIQRLPPRPPAPARPPKKSSLKAKRAQKRQRQAPPAKGPATKKGRPSKKREDTPPPKVEKVEEPISGARRRTQVSFYGNLTPTIAALKKGAVDNSPSSSRSTRSTRNNPVDNKPTTATAETPSRRGKGKQVETKPVSLPRGTRVSRRNRDTDEEWQQVPDEWLGAGASGSKKVSGSGSTGSKRKKPIDDDEESELSELTDEEEHEAAIVGNGNGRNKVADDEMDVDEPEGNEQSAASSELSELEEAEPAQAEADEKDEDFTPASDGLSVAKQESDGVSDASAREEDEGEEQEEEYEAGNGDDAEAEDEVKMAVREANNLPEGFIEWEAVCVTLYDWRTFPEQFAKSRDPDEKALYTLLTKHVGPTIIAVLVEKLQEIAKQEAVLNRKRSSRIATIQLSKEEALRVETAQREMEERMERTRYEETRHEREAAAHARLEQERDSRLREREERALAREEAIMAKAREESEKAEQAEKDRQYRAKRREEGFTVVTPTPLDGGNGSQADRWELNCEVCKKTGWNVDDDENVVACEDCGRWQHMKCHDLQDMREGRRKRDWDKVDFRCKDCLNKLARRQATSLPGRTQPTAPRSDSNGSASAMHQPASRVPQPAPNHPHPHHAPHPSQLAHQPPPSPHSNQASRQGPPAYPNQPPHGQVSSSSRPSYPPARPHPQQPMSPYSQQPALHTAYPPHGPPSGYPPQSPRQGVQVTYPQGPYQNASYGPPPDARSPYHPQQVLPHPQHRSPYQSGPPLPRQTPPHHPQHLPPQQYPLPHPQAYSQQQLPPPPQGYPPHPSYQQGHYPQAPYQGPPPQAQQSNGYPQHSAAYPPHVRAPSGERHAPVAHNGPGPQASPQLPTQMPRSAEPVHPHQTQG